ncbi:hypothetical protein ACIGXF_30600 [Streptomyces sp. NPDC053086]|uniref:hypothetical protein n=1 Tax=unclassified Streptomyces TaxID=2593676 RepID=UPI0037D3FC75
MTIRIIGAVRMRHLPVVAALALCCSLTSCGTRHADGSAADRAGTSAAGRTADGCPGLPDTTSDDDYRELPDTTTDDEYQELPDTTTDDDYQELPDTTSDDDYQELPDATTDDQGLPDSTTDDGSGLADTTGDDPADAGSSCWFPMRREFRAYLTADGRKTDAAIAPHVESVRVRASVAGGRTESVVRVDYGVGEQEDADRTAGAFAGWRASVYGDHGHVEVLGPAKTVAERDW